MSNTETHLYQQETDFQIIAALAGHVRNRTFLDVGAEKGSFSQAMLDMGFEGSLFEPFPPHHASLEKLVSGRPARLFTCAVDDSDHEGTLHIATDEGGETMDYFHSLQRLGGHSHVKHSKEIAISCRSLSSLAKEGRIDGQAGILKIDTEGNDLKVIEGMGDVRVEVLICEFITPGLYEGWELAFPEKLIAAARGKGYSRCIAVKRLGGQEFVSLHAAGFIDGEWGNLIFTSAELFDLALPELERVAAKSENALSLALKEAESTIQSLRSSIESQDVLKDKLQAAKERAEIEAAKKNELKEKLRIAKEEIQKLQAVTKRGGWLRRKLRGFRS